MKLSSKLMSALLGATAILAVAATSAKSEDLVIYDAVDFTGAVAKAFTAKTGINVQLVEPGSTGELLGKIAAEGSNPQFDLVWVDGSAVMERMLNDKVLQPVPDEFYAKADFSEVGKKLVPPSHSYLPTSVSTTSITVNSKKIPADKMPKSFADLLTPEFIGKVGAKDPNLSGPSFQFIAGIFQTMGEEKGKEFLKALLTDKKLSGLASGGPLNKAMLTGDAVAGFAQDSSTYGKIAKGEPLTVVYPSEGSVALPTGLGMGINIKNKEAATKFIDFVLSKEGQAAMQDGDDTDFFLAPIINGVEAKKGRTTDINFIYLDNAKAAPKEAEWKKWYRDNFVP
jgi:iron(III) transport system substrate-binding protein